MDFNFDTFVCLSILNLIIILFFFYLQFPKKSPIAQNVRNFEFQPRKKLSHFENAEEKPRVDSTVHNLSGNSPYSSHNAQKSIKWRSPLVYSPPNKYSPKMPFDLYENVEENIKYNTIQG